MTTHARRLTDPLEKEPPDHEDDRAEENSNQTKRTYQQRGRKAKRLIQVESKRLQWPKTRSERGLLVKAWHCVSMQILHEVDYSFRLVSPVMMFLNWETGSLWPSNRTLAKHAGGCSEATISIDVKAFEKMGLIQIDEEKRPGYVFPKRVIWLSLPINVADTVFMPDDEDATDTVFATDDPPDADTVSVAVSDTVLEEGTDTVSEQPLKTPLEETIESTPTFELNFDSLFLIEQRALRAEKIEDLMERRSIDRDHATNILVKQWIIENVCIGFDDVELEYAEMSNAEKVAWRDALLSEMARLEEIWRSQ